VLNNGLDVNGNKLVYGIDIIDGKKVIKVSWFRRLLIKWGLSKHPKSLDNGEEEEVEPVEPPRLISSQALAESNEFYKKEYSMKEIKRIYKRIINP